MALYVPNIKTTHYGINSLKYNGPSTWNSFVTSTKIIENCFKFYIIQKMLKNVFYRKIFLATQTIFIFIVFSLYLSPHVMLIFFISTVFYRTPNAFRFIIVILENKTGAVVKLILMWLLPPLRWSLYH